MTAPERPSSVSMKTIGHRSEPELLSQANGAALAAGARFSEGIAHLAKSTFIPKGVYRFKTHEAANKHQQDCLARDMRLLAAERARDRAKQQAGNT
jgi:hypothetical protein